MPSFAAWQQPLSRPGNCSHEPIGFSATERPSLISPQSSAAKLGKMAKSAKFEYYQDRSGFWRWHLKAPNGEILADSGQSYRYERDCLHGIQLVQIYDPTAQVVRV